MLGWPIDDVIPSGGANARSAVQPGMEAMVELIRRVDAEEPIDKLELVLKRDPSLAFKLMRYIKQYNKVAKPFRWSYADPTRRIA